MFADQNDYKDLKAPKYVLKVETETTIKSRLVVNIEILLDTASIALQNRRKKLKRFKQV